MFGFEIIAFHQALKKARDEAENKSDELFFEQIKIFNADEQQQKIAERKQYKIDERRHQELCASIRSTKHNINIRNNIF